MKGTFTIGIDSGTQSTKAVLMNVTSGKIVAEASASYQLFQYADGSSEQNPADWVTAIEDAICSIMKKTKIQAEQVIGIGVSGQQHGFVPLDLQGRVIRPAKLWNDCSTQKQCQDLIDTMGGLKATIEEIGNNIPPGFTASKIKWLKELEPQNYERLATILLPHNYINFWLTGQLKMEAGDASGSAFFDVAERKWSQKALHALDSERDLSTCLPELQESHEVVGTLTRAVAAKLGLSENCIVSSGGGDNMMSAIGTGNVRAGVVTASLGTSGTIFAYSDSPVIDHQNGEIAAFCDSTGGWLPLLCVMNCTVSTELTKKAFGLSNAKLTRLAHKVSPGSDGLVLLPYFTGERTPNLPNGKGVFFGVDANNYSAQHFARATMEGTILGMNYGLRKMESLGINPTQIRLTGGGAKNKLWRQICADVFNCECRTLKNDEAAAFGGAIQALWAYNSQSCLTDITSITDKFVKLDSHSNRPNSENVEIYKELFEKQNKLRAQLIDNFKAN